MGEFMATEREHFEELDPMNDNGAPLSSIEHYYTCPTCAQAVDRRHLDEVVHHARDGHRPLAMH